MREYYRKHKDHISEMRKKCAADLRVSDEVREQRRLRRKELREEKKQRLISVRSSEDTRLSCNSERREAGQGRSSW